MEIPSQSAAGAGSKPHLSYKSLLNQYAQRSNMQLPIYQTYNEGLQHQPKFRSTVWFDEESYTSQETFPQRKVAEDDASRVAFFAIMQKVKEEGIHLIRKESVFCKSILIEYAARTNLEKPSYHTIQPSGSLPVFVSSLIFKGVSYTGDTGRNKKEAEQLAARAAILSILDNESRTVMSEIIKSKLKIYAAMNKVKDSCSVHNGVRAGHDSGVILVTTSKDEVASGTNMSTPATSEPCLVQPNCDPATCPPLHASQPPKLVASSVPFTPIKSAPPVLQATPFAGTHMTISSSIPDPSLGKSTSLPATHLPLLVTRPPNLAASPLATTPIISIPPIMVPAPDGGSTSTKKRNRKNKRIAQKKMRADAQSPMAVA